MASGRVVLAVGDLHAPFMHPDAVDFLAYIKKQVKPDTVVLLGDEIDAHALSDYDHDPDGYSPGHELEAAKEQLQDIYRLFPKALVCHSNHTQRPFRKAMKFGLPASVIRGIREILDAPRGWQWAQQWCVDGVLYEHGEGYTGQYAAIRMATANMQSTVIGHIHAFAGINYNANPDKLYWGFNAGCLIDKDAYSFRYAKNIKAKPIIGVGVVDRGIPRFIPMQLNRRGRWKR